jgi:hypothetical protein
LIFASLFPGAVFDGFFILFDLSFWESLVLIFWCYDILRTYLLSSLNRFPMSNQKSTLEDFGETPIFEEPLLDLFWFLELINVANISAIMLNNNRDNGFSY